MSDTRRYGRHPDLVPSGRPQTAHFGQKPSVTMELLPTPTGRLPRLENTGREASISIADAIFSNGSEHFPFWDEN